MERDTPQIWIYVILSPFTVPVWLVLKGAETEDGPELGRATQFRFFRRYI